MPRIFSLFAFVLCAVILVLVLDIGPLHARCAYYAGYGYRCFGDKGGTGGKVFKEMEENEKKCGYWDPGCTKSNPGTGTQAPAGSGQQYSPPQSDQSYTPPQSDRNYTPPQSDGGYKSPTVGPGYQPPGSR